MGPYFFSNKKLVRFSIFEIQFQKLVRFLFFDFRDSISEVSFDFWFLKFNFDIRNVFHGRKPFSAFGTLYQVLNIRTHLKLHSL